jgi:hypothetical protein
MPSPSWLDRTGVQQQYIRFRRILGELQRMGLEQRIRHPRGVILVHLASEGLDE